MTLQFPNTHLEMF